MARFYNLNDWLTWQEGLHSAEIDMGLERVYQVALNLNLINPPSVISHNYSGELCGKQTVVTVAGTNGKGSCISTLQQSLISQEYQVGSYTSPHLHHYCERICVNGLPVSERSVCDAFEAIDQARGNISLTYFEFGTLAALWIFVQAKLDYVLLEVGLGGRLDAVNIVDTDIAIITSIDIDHQDWLGDNRDVISAEKLGIARASRPLIIAETALTPNLHLAIKTYSAHVVDQNYSYEVIDSNSWCLNIGDQQLRLAMPSLALSSVAAALYVLTLLEKIPKDLNGLMSKLNMSGRFECASANNIPVIYDVAHNPAAALLLSKRLHNSPIEGKTMAVVAMMRDKDVEAIFTCLADDIEHWYISGLIQTARAATVDELIPVLERHNQAFTASDTIESAFQTALTVAEPHDRIVVFGSFFTVAAVQSVVSDL
ncbi:MAG: bifunctional tetrahydrofolate synthase/dihydrofolate synthase [Cellvibrionaceae bacterium]